MTPIELDPKKVVFDETENVRGQIDRTSESFRGLVESIRALGPLQPPLVRDAGESHYHLIAGFRRHLAYLELDIAKATYIVLDDSELGRANVAENTSREDVELPRLAASLEKLADKGFSSKELARATAMSEQHVRNLIRLRRKLSPEMLDLWTKGASVGDLLSVAAKPKNEQRAHWALMSDDGAPKKARAFARKAVLKIEKNVLLQRLSEVSGDQSQWADGVRDALDCVLAGASKPVQKTN